MLLVGLNVGLKYAFMFLAIAIWSLGSMRHYDDLLVMICKCFHKPVTEVSEAGDLKISLLASDGK